jgi:hypothetical protein
MSTNPPSPAPPVVWRQGALSIRHTEAGIELSMGGRSEVVPFASLDDLIDFVGSVSVRERRMAFRVPILEDMRGLVQVRVRVGGRARTLELIDLSLSGCRTSSPRGWVMPPEPFPLGLRLEEQRVLLTAEVVRRTPRFTAIRFVDTLRNGDLKPPDALVKIQRALELAWLRGRVDMP